MKTLFDLFNGKAWRCFRNWKKWRQANALGKAAAILWNDLGSRKDCEISLYLMDRQTKIYREIHKN